MDDVRIEYIIYRYIKGWNIIGIANKKYYIMHTFCRLKIYGEERKKCLKSVCIKNETWIQNIKKKKKKPVTAMILH